MSDAVVIGSGPNGLAAAIRLAQAGVSVTVIEAHKEIGGGTRTAKLTLPGFQHDVCSAAHPMGVVSPFFKTLPLDKHGLTWIFPEASAAHPLDSGSVGLLLPSVEETAARLGVDARKYHSLFESLAAHGEALVEDSLNPTGFPKHPFLMARFGLKAIQSAESLARCFKTEEARALIAGCAAHSILPLDKPITAAVALMFMLIGHMRPWPVAKGGSQAIAKALASYFKSLGGKIETGRRIASARDLPPAKVYLFDTSPNLLVNGFSDVLPAGYLKRLNKFRYGPGIFKVDYALKKSIPWKNADCLKASTVHIGGTFEEIAAGEAAVWRGEHPERPYVLMTQQSEFDKTRAPKGKHTLWAYIHVPHGSTVDMSGIIENQIERFAPGFKKTILKRHKMHTADFESYNPNYVGGAITGGVSDIFQFVTRPVARLNPYTTPNPRIFICSASTPPGGGVHGMCGFHAANAALKTIRDKKRGLKEEYIR